MGILDFFLKPQDIQKIQEKGDILKLTKILCGKNTLLKEPALQALKNLYIEKDMEIIMPLINVGDSKIKLQDDILKIFEEIQIKDVAVLADRLLLTIDRIFPLYQKALESNDSSTLTRIFFKPIEWRLKIFGILGLDAIIPLLQYIDHPLLGEHVSKIINNMGHSADTYIQSLAQSKESKISQKAMIYLNKKIQ